MPERETLNISSQAVELSETATYLELTNRLCYYGHPNLNGVLLPVDDAEERAKTLINQPVVAKYKQSADGKPNLGGHECTLDPVTKTVKFGTENVGVHTAVEVKNDTVSIAGEMQEVPCLFATLRIWARNKNVVKAIKRLFAEGKLFNSWEILTSAYEYSDGIKILTDYVFEACALLGTNNPPAFGEAASALALSSECDPEVIIAEALTQDMADAQSERGADMTDETKVVVADEELANAGVDLPVDGSAKCGDGDDEKKKDASATDEVEDTSAETASLTVRDLRDRITSACRAALGERCWGWIAWMFPEEHIVWFEDCDRKSELDYLVFTYEVNDDVVTVSEPTPCSLAVMPKNVNATLAEKDAALVSANDKIQELQSEVDRLTPYFEAAEKAEKEAKRAELVTHALKSKLISEEDISSCEDIVAALDALDRAAINSIIADRLVQKMEAEQSEIETAEVKPEAAERADVEVDPPVSSKQFVHAYISGAKKGN